MIDITGPEPIPPASPHADRLIIRDSEHIVRTRKGLVLVEDASLEIEAIRHRLEGWVSMYVTEKFEDSFGEKHERTIQLRLDAETAVKLAKFIAYGD